MKQQSPNRRQFIREGLAAGAAAGMMASGLNAAGYGRVIGSNDRIRVAHVGCGGRATRLMQEVHNSSEKANATSVAVCDIWRQNREKMGAEVEKLYGSKPVLYKDYRQVLDQADVDAVVFGTPDHQHCGQLIDAVQAGKDVYVEKPICLDMEELNKAYDTVTGSKAVVQMGTQGRSDPGTAAAREFLASGKLGKLFRVESWISRYEPYWNDYVGPESESDTDWRAFLYNRPYRPFNSDQHGAWMGYHEFSTGPIGGWMSHYSDFVHAATGCGLPLNAVCHGGIFAPTSDRRRTAPDTVTCMLEYPEGFVTEFTTHFGNTINSQTTIFYGDKGVMRTLFGHAPRVPVVSGEGSEHPDRIASEMTLEAPKPNHHMLHMLNWLECVRSRKQPVANMDAGYMQGVAVVMGDMAYVKGCKVVFDKERREVRAA